MTTTSRPAMPWLIILAGSLIAVMTFGPRSAMGFFQLPMLADRGWDRSTFGLAMAFQNLFWGISQPFFGALADKYGTGRVLVMSGFRDQALLELQQAATYDSSSPVALACCAVTSRPPCVIFTRLNSSVLFL